MRPTPPASGGDPPKRAIRISVEITDGSFESTMTIVEGPGVDYEAAGRAWSMALMQAIDLLRAHDDLDAEKEATE